jgi:L,D-transpeptidase catalytic domain
MLCKWLIGIVLILAAASPSAALAAGKPTPTPVPTQIAAKPTPVAPTPVPVPPTSVPAAPPAPVVPTEAEPPQPADAPPAAAAEAAPADQSPPAPTEPTIADDAFTIWHGVVRAGGAYRRAAPSASAEISEELDAGMPIRVDAWVPGGMLYPDVITWAQVDPDDGGGYIFGGSLQGVLPPATPPPPDVMANTPNWVDVNLTLNVVTMYEDGHPIKSMLASPGRPGFQTDTGLFSVRGKFPRQTMSGPGYTVPGVPNVQYFVGGEALHGRYWTLPDDVELTSADIDENGLLVEQDDPPAPGDGPNRGVAFGVPSSHGCVGLAVDDALWLYSQTGFGTPVDVHY